MDTKLLGRFLQGIGQLMTDDDARAEFQERLRVAGKKAASQWIESSSDLTPAMREQLRQSLNLRDDD